MVSPERLESMQKEWVQSVRDQCAEAGVAFFFKQWGGVRKSDTGRTLDGNTHDAKPASAAKPIVERRVRLKLLEEAEELSDS